jgi:tRNA (cmo5U34)-methyltransferase
MDSKTAHDRFSGVLGDDYNLFAKSVPYYDRMQDVVGEQVAKYVETSGKDSVTFIEAGTGTGLTSIRVLGADARVFLIGIDNEKKMLDQARLVLKEFEGRMRYIQGDLLESLRRQLDGLADGFVSGYTLHNFPPEYRDQVFSEIKRVLKSGGIFINADKYALDDLQAHKQTLEDQIQAFDVYDGLGRSDVKNEWTEHYNEDEKIKISESEQVTILENLDFLDVKKVFREGMDAIIVATKI